MQSMLSPCKASIILADLGVEVPTARASCTRVYRVRSSNQSCSCRMVCAQLWWQWRFKGPVQLGYSFTNLQAVCSVKMLESGPILVLTDISASLFVDNLF